MRFLVLFLSIIFYSCAGYRVTKFSTNSIRIGDNKELVIEQFGNPFKVEKNKSLEVLYYKEAVDVSNYTYILTTILTFENSVLVKMEQKEEIPNKVEIKSE